MVVDLDIDYNGTKEGTVMVWQSKILTKSNGMIYLVLSKVADDVCAESMFTSLIH